MQIQLWEGTVLRCITLVLYRMRVLAEGVNGGEELLARPVKPFGGDRPWLRRTRALCKFNCGKGTVLRCAEAAPLREISSCPYPDAAEGGAERKAEIGEHLAATEKPLTQ